MSATSSEMIVGVCHVMVQIPGARSLKDKRGVVKSLIARVSGRFNVSIAEVDHLDVYHTAGVGICCVSNSAQHADEVIQHVIRFVEDNLQDGYIADVRTEIIYVD